MFIGILGNFEANKKVNLRLVNSKKDKNEEEKVWAKRQSAN